MGLTAHEDCVVIVIDAQPGFHPPDLPEADRVAAAQALDRAAWLVKVAAHLEIPIVVTEEEPEHNGPTDERLAVGPAFVKPTFGLAGTPALLDAVLATRRQTAVLVGFETDVCVYQSAVGLLEHLDGVIVVEDATFSPGEMHARGLTRLRDAGARLTHAKGLAYEWVRTVERGAAVLSSGVLGPAPFRT
jgi:nicotinamidase-related amidase